MRDCKEERVAKLKAVGFDGLGKTYNTRKILGKNICYVNSNSTVLACERETPHPFMGGMRAKQKVYI